MSRSSIRTFLLSTKRHLQQTIHDGARASFVVGNEAADLDSITCALVYGYILSSSIASKKDNHFVIPVTNIPAADLPLRPELTTLLKYADLKPSDLITLDDIEFSKLPAENTDWTLVDHNALTGLLAEHYTQRITGVIDHHDDERVVPQDATPRIITKSGSCSSLVVNHIRSSWDDLATLTTSIGASHGQDDKLIDDFAYTSTWDAQVAKLSLASILIDTYNLKDETKVTDHDLRAVRYLEARIFISPKLGKSYNRDRFFQEISDAKSDMDDISLVDILRKDYKEWEDGGLKLGTSAVVRPVQYLSTKDEHLEQAFVQFAQEKNIDVFAVMTAYNSDSGDFERQLVLLAAKDGKAVEVVKKFATASNDELELEEKDIGLGKDEGKALWCKSWQQGNIGASRKRVAPLLREAMKA
ncbi:DHH phosphoesterase [Polychaeton citri CBS 116435]|uniref:DHH phosphoesterase n=1 Tax=Polychaeton citri CBS 116435 TaxID=1314669 RepID=A0A9P4QDA2_9PEZI|nr:DHH phosphoesterase [Polychaeton citri CBS 116435]